MTPPSAITAPDGVEIALYRWLPDGVEPRAAVQIAHGAAEHAGRYERLARVLTGAGYAVYANDHRGHGRTAGSPERFGIAGPDGWSCLVADAELLTERIARAHPGRPIALIGHSMGSLVAQAVLQHGAPGLRAVVLSGTLSSLPTSTAWRRPSRSCPRPPGTSPPRPARRAPAPPPPPPLCPTASGRRATARWLPRGRTRRPR